MGGNAFSHLKWLSMSACGTRALVLTPLTSSPKLREQTHMRAQVKSARVARVRRDGATEQISS